MATTVTTKPSFSAPISITISALTSLVSGGTATSNAIDNSTNLYDEVEIEIVIAGTASATAWLDVRIVKSIDGSNYGTWESALVLPQIMLSATPQRYHCRIASPQYWKIMVKNNTGATLGTCSANYQGINPQGTV